MKKKTADANGKKESAHLQKRIERIMAVRERNRSYLKPIGRIPKQNCS